GERRGLHRVELPGGPPDLQISLLHHIGGEIVPAQNPQHDAIELGASGLIETLEGSRVTLGDSRQQPSDFDRRRHRSESVSPRRPWTTISAPEWEPPPRAIMAANGRRSRDRITCR